MLPNLTAEANVRTTNLRLLLRKKDQFMKIIILFQDTEATTFETVSLKILLPPISV
jgi:hypothetical protein